MLVCCGANLRQLKRYLLQLFGKVLDSTNFHVVDMVMEINIDAPASP